MKSLKLFFTIVTLFLGNNLYGLQTESEHFIFYYEAVDSSIIDDLSSRLETNYVKITSDLRIILQSKTRVHIYPDLQTFHNAIGWPDAPDWLCGVGGTEISVVSPLNPGPQHTYDEMINNVILHEFVHICTDKINYNTIAWVAEGYALYTVGPFYSDASLVNAYNRMGKIPSLNELANFNSFSTLSGYQIAGSIFRFAFEKFGKKAVIDFLYNTSDFSVFGGLNKAEFQEQWFNYVKVNYLGFTSIEPKAGLNSFELFQNYPNPFNPVTNFEFRIADFGFINFKIFDVVGNIITTLVNEQKPAGVYKITWNAKNFTSGTYFYQLKAGNFTQTKKLILMK